VGAAVAKSSLLHQARRWWRLATGRRTVRRRSPPRGTKLGAQVFSDDRPIALRLLVMLRCSMPHYHRQIIGAPPHMAPRFSKSPTRTVLGWKIVMRLWQVMALLISGFINEIRATS